MGDFFNSIFDFMGDAVVGALESFVVWLYQLVIVIAQALYQIVTDPPAQHLTGLGFMIAFSLLFLWLLGRLG